MKINKRLSIIYLLAFLIFNSCIQNGKNGGKDDNLFNDVQIVSVGFNNDRSQNYINVNDSILTEEVNVILDSIYSRDLIRGKRQHGAKNLFSLKLISKEGNDLILFINETDENKITIDFFEENRGDNFSYFLGCLYQSEDLYKLLNERLSKFLK